MKIGVKTFDNEKFLKYFEDKVDFFEVMAVQKNDYSFLKNFSLPVIIHAEHQCFGINPADVLKKEQNIKSLNFAIKIADSVKAKKIIVHPGIIEEGNKNCSLENAINFFSEFKDDRIFIENLPPWSKGFALCRNEEQIKEFLDATKKPFCFDINHAISAMKKFDGRYDFVKNYVGLKPLHYHIGGQKVYGQRAHLSFVDSDLNLKEILKYFPRDAEITLETEIVLDIDIDTKKVEKDVEIIRKIIELNKY